MTGEALRFLAGRRGLAVDVRVMAGHAAQVAVALGVTPAPGQGQRLEAVKDGVGPGRRDHAGVVEVMALAARLVDHGTRQPHGIDDGEVREPGLRRRDMMTARPVTFLAADREVGRLGTGLVQDGAEVGRVAEQTAPDAIALEHRGAQVLVRVLRPRGQAGGQVPSRPARGLKMGDAKHSRSAPVVPADEGHEMVARSERIVDHRTLDLSAGAGLDLERSVPPLEVMGDLVISRVRHGVRGED